MKAAVVVLLLALVGMALANKICDPDLITAINKGSHNWQAECSSRFEGATIEEVKRNLMPIEFTHPRPRHVPSVSPARVLRDVPASFDARTQWPGCVHPIRDQAQCGSCWAFGASEALSDRFCIQTNGTVNVVLSPQDLVSCDSSNSGCNGGVLRTAWSYLVNTGIVSDACMPYTSADGTVAPCPSTCKDGSAMKRYKAKNSYHVGSDILFWKRVEDIQNEIMTNGPVETGFDVYQDFMNYKSGVYKHVSGSLLGGHAVKIVGWGHDDSVNEDYWIVANSWGTGWGEQGFFRILRGKDECNFEADVYAGEVSA